MGGVETMGILVSGKAQGGRDATHRNQRSNAARKQKRHRRSAVAHRAIPAPAICEFAA
jgi:hypothetical protein